MTYNSAYTGPQIDKAARLASIIFDDLPAMLADARDYTAHTAGDVFWTATEGFRYRVAASDASDHHLTTAGGVKLYVLPDGSGVYNFKAFNPAADGETDDYDKLMLALGAAAVPTNGDTVRVSGPTIFFPDASYFIGSTVNLKSTVSLVGGNSGHPFRTHPVLLFPADTTGIIINMHYTLDGETVTPTTWGIASLIQGIRLVSAGGTDAESHGIWLRGAAQIRNVVVEYFPGNGINIVGGTDGQPYPGVPNMFYLEKVRCDFNKGSGVYCEGIDSNAGVGVALDCSYNGRWGVEDNSFLGNTWIGCHAAANGVVDGPGTSLATYGGKCWHASPFATEAQYVATQPGTNYNIWNECIENANHVDWEPGLKEGTYKAGGSYCSLNENARSLFMNCYAEEGQGAIWLSQHSLSIGGIPKTPVYNGAYMIGDFGVNEGRAFCAANPNRTTGNMIEATLGGTPSEGVILRSQIADREEWVLRYRLGDGDIRYGPGFGDGAEAMIFTTSNTGYTMGRSAPQPYVAVFNRFALGVGINARQHTARDAAPTAGEWARGDVVWNINPTAAGWAGWICVRAGTPGTWKRFGAIEA